jgi:hypothetical protein
MLNPNIDAITSTDIERLIEDEVPEGKRIDYKEDLKLENKDFRRTFCEHVTSFANALGGWLIFGVREATNADGRSLGTPSKITGIGAAITDDELLRLVDETLRSGVEPRLGFRARIVSGFEGGARVLVVEVHKSFRGPHMVSAGRAKFFTRTNAGKEALDVDQLRAAFGASDTLAERINEFRMERIARVVAGDTPVRLHYDSGRVVLHLVPLSAFSTPMSHSDIVERAADSREVRPLYHEGSHAYSHHFNLDGFCFHDELDKTVGGYGYVQFFRQGMIEAVDSIMLRLRHENGAGKLLTHEIEKYVQRGLQRYAGLARTDLGIDGPAVVMLSLVNVAGYVREVDMWRFDRQRPLDRAQVLLPDVVVDDIADAAASSTLKPIFDAMWQAAGERGSPNFGKDGVWKTPRDR